VVVAQADFVAVVIQDSKVGCLASFFEHDSSFFAASPPYTRGQPIAKQGKAHSAGRKRDCEPRIDQFLLHNRNLNPGISCSFRE
jgi:hypothetical protein